MLIDNELSTRPIYGVFLIPDKSDPMIDYEQGGIDLLDTSQGLQVKLWLCYYKDGWIKISDGDSITHSLIQVENVKHLSLAFDFNMHATIAYTVEVTEGAAKYQEAYLYWYDTAQAKQITTKYGKDYKFPQLSLDDHRFEQSASADIIFAYIKNNNLYYRQQRDRFLIERLLYENLDEFIQLRQIGLNRKNRFQFLFW